MLFLGTGHGHEPLAKFFSVLAISPKEMEVLAPLLYQGHLGHP